MSVQEFRATGIFPFNLNLFSDHLYTPSETTNYEDTATGEYIRRAVFMEILSLTSTEMKNLLPTSKNTEASIPVTEYLL